MRKIVRDNTGLMAAGQDLVAVGYAGARGGALIAQARKEELRARFSESFLNQAACRREVSLPEERGYWLSLGAAEFEPVGEGGILNALWNLTGAYGLGMEFSLRAIPLRQETVEICEEFGLNPYRLYSEDCAVATAANGGRLAQQLKKLGIPAAVVGRIKKGVAREILTDEGTGYLERPQEDELKKVLPGYFGE